jgi:hypothetical protein
MLNGLTILNKGKFEFNNNGFEFTYSGDSSDDNERFQNFILIWFDDSFFFI